MTTPRQGKLSHASHALSLRGRDPRMHRNAQGGLTDNDIDGKTIVRDNVGRARLAVADGMREISSGATLSEVITAYNRLLRAIQGG